MEELLSFIEEGAEGGVSKPPGASAGPPKPKSKAKKRKGKARGAKGGPLGEGGLGEKLGEVGEAGGAAGLGLDAEEPARCELERTTRARAVSTECELHTGQGLPITGNICVMQCYRVRILLSCMGQNVMLALD